MSAQGYLQNLRLTHAENLLGITNLSIGEIALDSGFSDGNYFARFFRQKHGISPRKFRLSRPVFPERRGGSLLPADGPRQILSGFPQKFLYGGTDLRAGDVARRLRPVCREEDPPPGAVLGTTLRDGWYCDCVRFRSCRTAEKSRLFRKPCTL